MKQIIKLLTLFILVLTFASCSKGSGGGDDTPAPQETNLVISFNPEPAGGLNQTMGATYTFNVVVQSTMPAQGVTIKVDYVKDSGGSVFTQTQTSTAASTAITINSIPFNEVGTVTVVVASISKPSNTTTHTFKLVRK